MKFATEEMLHQYLLLVLKDKGIPFQSEVWCGDIRADIVMPDAVIEVKKFLDRNSIYQALGQATAYNQHLKKKEIWIVGQTPLSTRSYEQANRIADEIEQGNPAVRISFVEEDPFWQLDLQSSSQQMSGASGLKFQLPSRLGHLFSLAPALCASGAIALGGYWALGSSPSPRVEAEPQKASFFSLGNSSAKGDRPTNTEEPALTSSIESPDWLEQTEVVAESNSYFHQTRNCNGGGNGYIPFASNPTPDSRAVIGVVPVGDAVLLTGQVVEGSGGDVWYEAIAPRFYNHDTQQWDSDRLGWLPTCYLN